MMSPIPELDVGGWCRGYLGTKVGLLELGSGMYWVFWEQVRLAKVLGITFGELEGEAMGWGVVWACRGVAGRAGWGANRRAWGSREFRGGAARLVLFGA